MKPRFNHIAEKLIQRNKIISPPIPIDKIAEMEGVKIEYAVLKENISGLLYRENNEAFIAVNSLHPIVRQRFTIAHELGHYLLGHKGDLFVDKGSIIFRNGQSATGSDKHEKDANQFAADILMPEEMILTELEENDFDLEDPFAVELLAKKFCVSTQAITYRLVNLGLVD